MNEDEILKGILEADKFRTDKDNYELIKIKRKGKILFSFHIRPLSEEEAHECFRRASKYSKQKKPSDPKILIDTDLPKVRSWRIYAATIDEDRAKVWDNKKVMEQLNVLSGVDVVDRVLLAGEKDQICDRIEALSGYEAELDETAKN